MAIKIYIVIFISIFFLINPIILFAKDRIIGSLRSDLLSDSSSKLETNIGNLITDVMREVAGTDISFINAGGIGESIKKGEITESQINKLTPYADDTIVILELKGEQIRRALEYSVRIYPKESLSFLQVSGIYFKFDRDLKPRERIREINILTKTKKDDEIKDEFVPLEDEKTYTVATNKFLAIGGLGYYRIFNEKNIIKDTKIKLRDALIKFIKDKKTIDYKIEGRIIVEGEEE